MASGTHHEAVSLDTMRHSAAHVMAEAVQQIWPEAKLGIGPAIRDGFYYDFDLPRTLSPDDLAEIERRMQAIIKANVPFETWELERDEALQLFRECGQPYKEELIEALTAGQASSEEAESPDRPEASVWYQQMTLIAPHNFPDLETFFAMFARTSFAPVCGTLFTILIVPPRLLKQQLCPRQRVLASIWRRTP